MEIEVDPHTWEHAEERAANREEIQDVINRRRGSILYDAKMICFIFAWMTGSRSGLAGAFPKAVWDVGEDNTIVGIDVLDASKHLALERLPACEI